MTLALFESTVDETTARAEGGLRIRVDRLGSLAQLLELVA